MSKRDEEGSLAYDSNMFARHKELNSRMRSTLLNWLIEKCTQYNLYIETT